VLVFVAVDAFVLTGTVAPTGVAPSASVLRVEFFVSTNQREPRVLVVTEGCGALSTLEVTGGTRLVAELPVVHVAMIMAAGASTILVIQLYFRLVALAAA
jgi:hypothetical protein